MIGMEGMRDGNPTSLITREHFAEMIRFENWLQYELEIPVPRPNATHPSPSLNGAWTTFDQICVKQANDERCVAGERALTFVDDKRTGSYNLEKYRSDEELVLKI